MSLVPETWGVVHKSRGKRVIARTKHEEVDRTTVWQLIRVEREWRISHIFFSKINPGLDRVPNRLKGYERPIRLSDSVIDNTLRKLANAR